jgi:transcriptional adapter 2-alpha
MLATILSYALADASGHVDITHSVRIKCAHKECDEIDLCVPCFMEGKELQKHEAWHAYKVVVRISPPHTRKCTNKQEQHSYPIFSPDWGADEELLLISGLMKDGLGNWAEAAAHIGTRTKEDCEDHYNAVYLGVGPDGRELDHVWEQEDDTAVVQIEGPPRKRRRREFMPVSYDTLRLGTVS